MGGWCHWFYHSRAGNSSWCGGRWHYWRIRRRYGGKLVRWSSVQFCVWPLNQKSQPYAFSTVFGTERLSSSTKNPLYTHALGGKRMEFLLPAVEKCSSNRRHATCI